MQTDLNFTKTQLEALPILESQYEVRDTKTTGLILRVNPGGIKTFMFYRRVGYKLLRIKIGRLSDIPVELARKTAIQLNSQIITGVNPNAIKKERSKELTFKELYQKYYAEHALVRTKRPTAIKATIDYHLIPKIGNLRLSDITRQRMKELHLKQGETSGKIEANRVLDMARAVFNFGIREEYYKGENPCVGIKRFKSKSRDRFLSQGELKLFFEALTYEEQLYQDFFQLCLFIGARKTTMLTMKYKDIDFDLKRWRLSEDETKNDEVNIHVLCDAAMQILQRRNNTNKYSTAPSPYVFPGDGLHGHLVDPKKSLARIKNRMGVFDFHIHDLRRTLGSYMAITNASMPIIGKALNHKSQVSTAIYARLSQDPILEAVNNATKLITSKIKRGHSDAMPDLQYIINTSLNFVAA